MQQLLEAEQNAETGAAQMRVTPQELAQATAAIEARQNAIAQHEATTIPIGEAVQQLHLEATPEEVLAEVQAQRRAKLQVGQSIGKRSTRSKAVKVMAAVIGVLLALMAFLGLRLLSVNQRLAFLKQELIGKDIRLSSLENTLQNFASPAPRPVNVQLLESNRFRTLDIPVGQTIRCKYNIIETLTKSTDFPHIYTATHPTGTTWELVRESSGFAVKCWTKAEDAQRLLNGESGVVYATKAGAFGDRPDTQIKIPVEAFRNGFIHATTDAPVGIVINGRR